MAQQTPRPTNRELRKLFVELSDRAIDLAASFQECGCDTNEWARISESPCDETSVDDPGDEALKTILDRHEEQASTLDELMTAPCEYTASPRAVGTPAPVRPPTDLDGPSSVSTGEFMRRLRVNIGDGLLARA